MAGWMQLSHILQTGAPAMAVNQEGEGAEFFHEFVADIFPLSYPSAQVLGDALGLASATETVRVLDVAAGSGVWGIALAQKSPHVQVTSVDWGGVVPAARKMVAQFGLCEQYPFVEGDLLEADYGSGHHIATLGHILHSEGEERSRKLLQKTFAALAPGGTIAIAEWIVNEERTAPLSGLIFAVNMLVVTQHGDTFTFGEIGEWLREAGFVDIRLLEAHGPSPLVLATKSNS